jgi:hypothetical protein
MKKLEEKNISEIATKILAKEAKKIADEYFELGFKYGKENFKKEIEKLIGNGTVTKSYGFGYQDALKDIIKILK